MLFPMVTCSSLRQSIDTDASAFITESTVNEAFSLARNRFFFSVFTTITHHVLRTGKGTFKTIISNNLGKNVKYYHMKN